MADQKIKLLRSNSETLFTRVFSHRALLRRLVAYNIKIKYNRSVLGFMWTFANPILTVGVLVTVFSVVVRIPIDQYWAFLVSGFFAWNLCQQTFLGSTQLLSSQTDLIRGVAFPTEVLVVASLLSRLFEFAVELLIVVTVLILFAHDSIPASLIILPIVVILHGLFLLGASLILAPISLFLKDLEHALPFLMFVLFYASPVFYPVSLVPESFQTFYVMNPFAQILMLYHDVLYQGVVPPLGNMLRVTVMALVTFIFGYMIFSRYKNVIAEHV